MAMRRPRIKRTTESFRAPDGDYYLRRPSANRDVRIESPDEAELRLLDALDGEHTLKQLHEEFGAEMVDDTIAQVQADETKARQAADTARKASSAASIFTALAMVIGAFIACAAAALGGQLRDLHP